MESTSSVVGPHGGLVIRSTLWIFGRLLILVTMLALSYFPALFAGDTAIAVMAAAGRGVAGSYETREILSHSRGPDDTIGTYRSADGSFILERVKLAGDLSAIGSKQAAYYSPGLRDVFHVQIVVYRGRWSEAIIPGVFTAWMLPLDLWVWYLVLFKAFLVRRRVPVPQ